MAEMTLVKKLAEVMDSVKYIQKTGYNSFNNYKYATEADVNEKVREELAGRKVIMIPNVKSQSIREHKNRKGYIEYIATVQVEFTFMDGESGETITFSTFGEGQDSGDKGTYKAITGAQKYALMKAFMIPTGDDPEGDTGVDERNNGDRKPDTTSGGKKQTGAITPVIKAKYTTVYGSLDGVEAFVAKHKKDSEKILTQQIQEKAKGAQKDAE
ncbi:ERF family protein [Paenibacillus larvae]|uniref:Single-stranded DNA-binding protein n=4 Tax=root TaxID=1 RepID=A0A0K2CYY2_9CAUD|nr:ERF family protein [Paenibacillus larvae]YP_009193874.1 ERF family protein [Paenibacillus phage Harrison]ALA12622.1 single-stranded DNA-binding protein [Paenibacillus phage Paisley]QVV19454.1 recombinase [Paenibacillus phage Bert]QVV19855.1 recombinase [Paenibacillus phage Mock2]UYL93243.1 ERF superfamily protein [Paenibacillus phage Callan]UYL93321.1 ERF superfamily protein [Paenibacillus phage Dash]